MADFCSEIENDVLRDCDNPPLAGLEQKVLIIPSQALDQSGITLDATNPNELITAISTNSGTQGYLIEGVQTKQWVNNNNTYVNSADSNPYYMHMLEGIRILRPDVLSREVVNDLTAGRGSYYAIVERLWKGTDSGDAFLFFGYDSRMTVPDGGLIDNSNENDGAIVVSLSTPEGLRESYIPRIFLDTDYATTQTAVWTNQLATA